MPEIRKVMMFGILISSIISSLSGKTTPLSVPRTGVFFSDKTAWKKTGKVTSVTIKNNMALVKIAGVKNAGFTFYKNGIIRFAFGNETIKPLGDTPAISRLPDYSPMKLTTTKEQFVISDDEKRVVINKKTGDIEVFRGDTKIVFIPASHINYTTSGFLKLTLTYNESPLFYGLGEKTGDLAKNGRMYAMWNTDAYKYNSKTDPIYQSIPFFISHDSSGYSGFFLNNSYPSFFDMGKTTSNQATIGCAGGNSDLFILSGEKPDDIVTKYASMTGTMRLPPLWSLGYQQCKFSYYPESRVLEVAQQFRKRKIPADVIYLDIDFMDRYKVFTYNKTYFPDPKSLIAELHSMGFKVITIIDPGIKVDKTFDIYNQGIAGNHFLKTADGKDSVGTVWPGLCVFPDFTRPETASWWGTLYKELVDFGFDGFWNDMNEPVTFNDKNKTLNLNTVHYDNGNYTSHLKNHNTYGMSMIKATLDGLQMLKPDDRNFVLSRSGFPGIQRYAAVWTGDNSANWEHLQQNLTMGLSMGLSGIVFNGADIGGYSGMPSEELYARWMAVGVLFPLFRAHSERGNPDKEPWALGSHVEAASKKLIELRYRLIAYLYDAVRNASLTGKPVTRPLFYDFPDDPELLLMYDQCMFGDSIMACPVINEGALTRSVYFPKGTDWFDFYTGTKYTGGTTADIEVPLDFLPLFVRDGGIVPVADVVAFIDSKNPAPLHINVYGNKNGSYYLYDDDGETLAYQQGEYTMRLITTGEVNGVMSSNVEIIQNGYANSRKIKKILYLNKEKL
ncbi:MAG: hypothetical protein A2Y29_03240 [Spirochaetes bacterium GWE2_31_10]|nr:MAG: hypothetical protein A2Y30_05260 [Spirochaetes bacterium GWE1_32_154]OHD48802.1 MAG: hypothetical protein A2Y29_03240 [Spirochaetes bacterium GWE2_31_10]